MKSESLLAKKNDQQKPDLSLLPRPFLDEVARAFMVGQTKYGRYNYKNGMEVTRLIAAALRHITAYNEGEENDPEDGQHHLGAAGACIAMILSQKQHGTLQDNRYQKEQEKEFLDIAKKVMETHKETFKKLAESEKKEDSWK